MRYVSRSPIPIYAWIWCGEGKSWKKKKKKKKKNEKKNYYSGYVVELILCGYVAEL